MIQSEVLQRKNYNQNVDIKRNEVSLLETGCKIDFNYGMKHCSNDAKRRYAESRLCCWKINHIVVRVKSIIVYNRLCSMYFRKLLQKMLNDVDTNICLHI